MSAQFRFNSFNNSDKVGYMFDNDIFTSRHHGQHLASWAYMYETYGDGNVQHSPEVGVSFEMTADFLQSLAIDISENEEHLKLVSDRWVDKIDEKLIKFVISVKHTPYDKEKKATWSRQYVNWHDQKLSRAEGKRHDKRWEEVTDFHNGTFDSVFWTVINNISGEASNLRRLATFYQIVNTWNQIEGHYYNENEVVKEISGIDNNRNVHVNKLWRETKEAFGIVDELVEAYKKRSHALWYIKHWQEQKAEKLAEVVA